MLLFPTEPEAAIVARVSVADDMIREVFDYWRRYHPGQFAHPVATLKEWIKIRLRFEEGYTIAQLCRAIEGMHESPFHQGENDRNKKYLTLELCLRDAGKVEQFIEIANQGDQPVLTEKTQRTARALSNWAKRTEEPKIETRRQE